MRDLRHEFVESRSNFDSMHEHGCIVALDGVVDSIDDRLGELEVKELTKEAAPL